MINYANSFWCKAINIAIVGVIYFFLMNISRVASSIGDYLIFFLFFSCIQISVEIIYDNINSFSSKYLNQTLLNNVMALIEVKGNYRGFYQLWGLITSMYWCFIFYKYYLFTPYYQK
ncbi:hypothetical protein; putative membrane protein [Xenorhabdus bovienii SS-2004]|uniref:Uncharacterized protein n=2 Tax=Xenorhabdus bovienii TaxID=40576 RepID=D3V8B6_XENBS|nr:hypothetical protein; putative membrane protein [Xenorhabdus bovienii SS-2004]